MKKQMLRTRRCRSNTTAGERVETQRSVDDDNQDNDEDTVHVDENEVEDKDIMVAVTSGINPI